MKSTLLTVTLAAAALFVVASPAEAQTRFHFSTGGGYSTGHYHGSHGYGRSSHSGRHSSHRSRLPGFVPPHHFVPPAVHCPPPVVRIRTQEISRCRRPMTAYHRCGRPYTYWVTTVTYRDYYSNGTWRDYTRTFS